MAELSEYDADTLMVSEDQICSLVSYDEVKKAAGSGG
jgi:hypothetical protein